MLQARSWPMGVAVAQIHPLTLTHSHAHRQMIKIYEFMRFGPELKLQALGDKLL